MDKEIKNYQVAWYDMERDGDCFGEDIYDPNDFHSIVNDCSCIISYEQEESEATFKRRLFVNYEDGTRYELVAKKVDSSKCSNYYGDKQWNNITPRTT